MKIMNDLENKIHVIRVTIYQDLVAISMEKARLLEYASRELLAEPKENECFDSDSIDEAVAVYDDISKVLVAYNKVFDIIDKVDFTEEQADGLYCLRDFGILNFVVSTIGVEEINKTGEEDLIQKVKAVASFTDRLKRKNLIKV